MDPLVKAGFQFLAREAVEQDWEAFKDGRAAELCYTPCVGDHAELSAKVKRKLSNEEMEVFDREWESHMKTVVNK